MRIYKTVNEIIAEDAVGRRFTKRIRMPSDSCPVPFFPVRTHRDMSDDELSAISAQYRCPWSLKALAEVCEARARKAVAE